MQSEQIHDGRVGGGKRLGECGSESEGGELFEEVEVGGTETQREAREVGGVTTGV